MNVKIEQSWKDVLGVEFDKEYFIKLKKRKICFVKKFVRKIK